MVNNFPKNLRYLRVKSGLRQAEMQSRLGILRTTWSNYETGSSSPKIDDLVNFAKFFGVTLDELIITDLEAKDPLPQKNSRRKKMVRYTTNDALTVLAEDEIHYIKEEIKKLREEMNIIKSNNKAQGSFQS